MKWRNQTRIANLRFNLFKGTVAEQISLQDESVTREQIEKALDFVGLTDYVAALENGLDTQVNYENLFSQGQKQLLSIVISVLQKKRAKLTPSYRYRPRETDVKTI